MIFIQDTRLLSIVDPTSAYMEPALVVDVEPAVSATVDLVTPVALVASSALVSSVGSFEVVGEVSSEVLLHTAAEFESNEVGVIPNASSLAEGHGDLGDSCGQWFGAARIERLLEHPLDANYLRSQVTRNAVIGGPLVRSQNYAAIHTNRAAGSHGKRRPRFPDEVGCRKTGIREERNARNEIRDCRSPTSPDGPWRTCALS